MPEVMNYHLISVNKKLLGGRSVPNGVGYLGPDKDKRDQYIVREDDVRKFLKLFNKRDMPIFGITLFRQG